MCELLPVQARPPCWWEGQALVEVIPPSETRRPIPSSGLLPESGCALVLWFVFKWKGVLSSCNGASSPGCTPSWSSGALSTTRWTRRAGPWRWAPPLRLTSTCWRTPPLGSCLCTCDRLRYVSSASPWHRPLSSCPGVSIVIVGSTELTRSVCFVCCGHWSPRVCSVFEVKLPIPPGSALPLPRCRFSDPTPYPLALKTPVRRAGRL